MQSILDSSNALIVDCATNKPVGFVQKATFEISSKNSLWLCNLIIQQPGSQTEEYFGIVESLSDTIIRVMQVEKKVWAEHRLAQVMEDI